MFKFSNYSILLSSVLEKEFSSVLCESILQSIRIYLIIFSRSYKINNTIFALRLSLAGLLFNRSLSEESLLKKKLII